MINEKKMFFFLFFYVAVLGLFVFPTRFRRRVTQPRRGIVWRCRRPGAGVTFIDVFRVDASVVSSEVSPWVISGIGFVSLCTMSGVGGGKISPSCRECARLVESVTATEWRHRNASIRHKQDESIIAEDKGWSALLVSVFLPFLYGVIFISLLCKASACF